MKSTAYIALFLSCTLLPPALAQTKKPTPAELTDKAQGLLKDAKAGTDGSKKSLQEMTDELKRAEAGNLPAKDRDALSKLIQDAEKPGMDAADLAQKVDEMLKSASPDAQKLMKGAGAATAEDAKPKKPSSTAPRSFTAVEPPAPKVLKAPGAKEKKTNPKALVIDADRLYMHQESRVAIFKGNVRLRSADLDADCEELEIIFKEGAFEDMDAAPAEGEAEKPKAVESPAEGTATEEEKIEKVWLKGNGRIITIVRRAPTGDATCKSKQAIYDAITGTLLLKEFPEAERMGKRLVGNTVASTITITKDMKITGVGTRASIDTTKPVLKKTQK